MLAFWSFGEGTTAERRIIRMVQAESTEAAWTLLQAPEWLEGVCPVASLSTPALLELLRARPPGEVLEVEWPETPSAYDRFRDASADEFHAAEDEGYSFT